MAKVHIGKKIKEVWKNSRLKGTEFATLINRDRQVIYDIFKRESIDTDLLKQISKVLVHDFFKYYSQDISMLSEPPHQYVKRTEFDALKEMVENISVKLNNKVQAKEYNKKKNSPKKERRKE